MFTEKELLSLYNLLRRGTYHGLDEAKAALLLAAKIEEALKNRGPAEPAKP